MRIVTDRNRGGSYLTIALTFCAMFAAFLFLTFFMQTDLGYSPLATGVAFLPMAAGIGLAAALANTRLVPRFGPRPLIPTGMAAGCGGHGLAGSARQAAPPTHTTSWAPSSCWDSAWGSAFSPAVATATSAVRPEDTGVASAMVSTSQQIGGSVGIAVLSTIFAAALERYLNAHHPATPLSQRLGQSTGTQSHSISPSGSSLLGAF